jgi:beta-glucosidase
LPLFADPEGAVKRGFVVVPLAMLAGVLFGGAAAQAQAASCPWMNTNKTPLERADLLISAMSLSQKLHETTFSNPPWFTHYGTAGHVDGDPSLCLPDINMSDAGSGVVGLQQGTTIFPSGIAQAATWDPSLSTRFGEALGQEAFSKGINVMLGPGMDMARTAINGRNFEYGGEDPYLTGQAMAAAIRGIQRNPVLAEAEHYLLNDQEHDRNTVDVHVDDRTLHEIYLAPFAAAVKQGHVGSVMCSYNLAFGHHVCENKQLLDGILRGQLGFDGFITSDWGATHSTVPTALAGMDLEMNVTPPQYYGSALGSAIAAGQVPMARLDTILRHIFVPMFRYGLFDHPVVTQPNAFVNQADTPAHRSLAREISEQSTVLLKNAAGLLPLDRGTGRTIAVIGSAANPAGAAGASGGGGSSHGTGLPSPVSPLEGIQALAATRNDRVLYADGSVSADATAVAKSADVAIVFIADSESEGADRGTLNANGVGLCATVLCGSSGQDENALVQTVAAANPNTVVVIDAGAPISMPWLGGVKSVLDAWYPGVENGNAIADLIYGLANPSGHLPQTFPRSLADMPEKTQSQYPGIKDEENYSEGLYIGYRYFDAHNVTPLFPFGYGLSYTTFSFSRLKVARRGNGADVTYTLRNTGSRAGADVGQVYVGFPSRLGEPLRQLKDFQKTYLEPGQAQRVTIHLAPSSFEWWSPGRKRWVETPGCYGISVGDSSRSLPLVGSVGIAARCGAALSCAHAVGALTATALGPIDLHATRSQARSHFGRLAPHGRHYVDYLCSGTPNGIRIGYAPAAVLRLLPASKRAAFAARVVLILTSSRLYSIDGIRPGMRFRDATRKVAVGQPYRVGANDWYLVAGRVSRIVLKVRGGIVREVGIASRRLTHTRHDAAVFLRSFS